MDWVKREEEKARRAAEGYDEREENKYANDERREEYKYEQNERHSKANIIDDIKERHERKEAERDAEKEAEYRFADDEHRERENRDF